MGREVVEKIILFGVRFPAGARDLSLLHSVQTGSEPKKPHIQWVPGPFVPEVKRLWREADHSLPSSTEVKDGGAITPPPIRLHGIMAN
jgi:hypothetical protein